MATLTPLVRLLPLLSLLLLIGCAKPLVIVPDNVGERGLLVAQVASQSMPEVLRGDPVIKHPDGEHRTHIGGIRGDTLIVPLHPGEYELSYLQQMTGSSSIPTAVGTMHQTSYRNYPVHRRFTIESGRATNLGMLIIEDAGFRRVLVRQANNQNEIERFLQDRYPATYASLRAEPRIVDAPGQRLDQPELAALRRHIADQRARDAAWDLEEGATRLIAGPAGTLAHVRRGADGVSVEQLVEAPTVTDLSGCSGTARRLACVSGPHHYLLVEGDRAQERNAPAGVVINSAHAFGERGVVLADDNMRLHLSRDGGRSWSVVEEAVRAKPFDRSRYRGIALNHVVFTNGSRGFYAFESGGGSNTGLVHVSFDGGTPKSIPLPRSLSRLRNLVETPSGVYLTPAYTEMAKGKVHFLPREDAEWQVYDLPVAGCRDMRVAAAAPRIMDVSCRSGYYRSEDGGRHWAPLFQAQSLFR
ncbi:hypothetical protein HUS23_05520 [Ectothiorhodospiraceae bacterium 2226]|nr:hypothetical protein HUS23_05520 [Ectothiorhodospiraceae bacterium 2226]